MEGFEERTVEDLVGQPRDFAVVGNLIREMAQIPALAEMAQIPALAAARFRSRSQPDSRNGSFSKRIACLNRFKFSLIASICGSVIGTICSNSSPGFGQALATWDSAGGTFDREELGSVGLGLPLRMKVRCRTNMAHVRQSRPDSGLGFPVKVLKTFEVFPSSRGDTSFLSLRSCPMVLGSVRNAFSCPRNRVNSNLS